ncbi:MAG: serine protein kinase RIO [Candidatus Woesearchaeota archaeon]
MPKVSREKFKVFKNVFDESTLNILFKLGSRGHFEELVSPVLIGKESNVFYAKNSAGEPIIVKIYRVENCNFNKMYDYIRQDPRFLGLKRQRRKVIFSWVQREYRNIFKAREAGVNVPKPVAVMDNVLLIEFIGNKKTDPPEVSPQLKDIEIKNPNAYFKKVINNMKKLHKAGLVHADLSAFNILDKNNVPYFIDFSQATTNESLDYFPLLARDVRNICIFFSKKGVSADPGVIFKDITGRNIVL